MVSNIVHARAKEQGGIPLNSGPSPSRSRLGEARLREIPHPSASFRSALCPLPAGEGRADCQASTYLYPLPVLKTTTVSSALIFPWAASLRTATNPAPPSGAAKIPSRLANCL